VCKKKHNFAHKYAENLQHLIAIKRKRQKTINQPEQITFIIQVIAKYRKNILIN
jgi:hypothetical protein